ncbi:hypothetical protein [Longimicrobium sp.]|uniref:hypothetical protein n=1 Tax=Longimicrobium sp. TaxID=2029185 RepID=UPI002E315329|nr:hypothetical protein [Longimicrobium sp.]HEX6038293.1 hypothetical protein [Longimicrobium sp.]
MIDDAAREAQLFGQVLTDLRPSALAEVLRGRGLDAQRRKSSHFAGGEYVRVHGRDDAELAMERTDPAHYLVHDAAGDPEAMRHLVRALSAALTALDLPHRLELYAEADEDALTERYAHRWTADAG